MTNLSYSIQEAPFCEEFSMHLFLLFLLYIIVSALLHGLGG